MSLEKYIEHKSEEYIHQRELLLSQEADELYETLIDMENQYNLTKDEKLKNEMIHTAKRINHLLKLQNK